MSSKFHIVKVNSKIEFEIPERYTDLILTKRSAFGQICTALDTIFKVKIEIKKWTNPFITAQRAKSAYRELKTMKLINHENIISLLDVFYRGDNFDTFNQLYLATDYLQDNLNNVIRTKRLANNDIKFLIYQIIKGLNYLHSIGITHNDLKPSDIGINKNFELKIIDLNLERPTDNEYLVTKWYRAPEVLYNWKKSNENVDLWSTGCIFAEFLSGRIIFAGRDHLQQLKLMVELLGSPKNDFFEPQCHLCILTQNLKLGEKYIRSLPVIRKKSFFAVFDEASELALDLLKNLLIFDPEKRISSETALLHPYFDNFPKTASIPQQKIDQSFEDLEYDVERWKELLYAEM